MMQKLKFNFVYTQTNMNYNKYLLVNLCWIFITREIFLLNNIFLGMVFLIAKKTIRSFLESNAHIAVDIYLEKFYKYELFINKKLIL